MDVQRGAAGNGRRCYNGDSSRELAECWLAVVLRISMLSYRGPSSDLTRCQLRHLFWDPVDRHAVGSLEHKGGWKVIEVSKEAIKAVGK